MMDRHLIYPLGWAQKKKGSDWDADPSLKGCIYMNVSRVYLTNSIFSRKMVPIQGTSLVLNTPEALDAWLAERKRRWPTTQRIEEKKKKMEEAVVRGQLPLVSNSFGRTKRHREEGRKSQWNSTHRHKLSAQTKRRKTQDTQDNQITDTHSLIEVPKTASGSKISFDVLCPVGDDDDEAPEMVSSKPPIGQLLSMEQKISNVLEDATEAPAPSKLLSANKFIRPRKREPKLPSRNPFAARPTLLRNVRFSC